MQKLPIHISGMIYDADQRRFLAHVRLHEPDGAVDYRLELRAPVTLGYEEAASEFAKLAQKRHRNGLQHRSATSGATPQAFLAAA